MKRTLKVPFLGSVRQASAAGGFVLGAVVLFGCPIYSGSSGGPLKAGPGVTCDAYGNCCDAFGNCSSAYCATSADCPPGAYCNVGYCQSGASTFDSGAPSDCSITGCPVGSTCTLTNGTAVCVGGPANDGGKPDATTDGSAGDGSSGDGTTLADARDAADAPLLPPFTGCTSDAVCVADGGSGARCLDGQCVPPPNQCFDSTQCPIVGSAQESCVQGVCTPSCAAGLTCPSGYACDPAGTGVCTANPTPCGTADGGAACSPGSTCVDQRCVPLCTVAADASESCTGTGMVCVDNGCIPDQKPQFVCNTEGVQDSCASGSICLHHNCYIACTTADAGDAGSGCLQADKFNLCKAVQTSTGTYDVCGSATNLGNQCDPTQNKSCMAPAICIDGYCR